MLANRLLTGCAHGSLRPLVAHAVRLGVAEAMRVVVVMELKYYKGEGGFCYKSIVATTHAQHFLCVVQLITRHH